MPLWTTNNPAQDLTPTLGYSVNLWQSCDQKLLKLHKLPISLAVRHIIALALREIEVGLESF